jgi:hypothetical protein
MKCPECKKAGKKSIVSPGTTTTTAMMTHSFYDEDGVYHVHDYNQSTTEYLCSEGHVWTQKHRRKCPNCDFNGTAED